MRNLLTLTVFVFLFNTVVFAQGRFDDVEIIPHQLTDQVYMLEGAGGNIGLVIGEDGALIIDSQFGDLSAKIKETIITLNDGPINYVMNTHWHGDHTGGNENFAADGAIIVAHQNVKERMSKESVRGGQTNPPSPLAAQPVITFGEDLQLYHNGLKMMAMHVDNAHTDGDVMIFIPAANVLHMGDTFFHQRYPYIDLSSGGSVDGVIAAAKAALLIVDEETQIIPGHGPMATKADLENYLLFLNTMKSRVQEYTTVGRGLESIDKAKVLEGYEDWAWSFINEDRIIEIFYNSLTAR